MASPRARLLVLVIAVLASVGLVLLVRARLAGPDPVKVLDTQSERTALLRERMVPPEDPPTGTPWPPPLIREPMDEETTRLFFPAMVMPGNLYDPLAYYVREPHFVGNRKVRGYPDGSFEVRTNGLSMRENDEPAAERPDLRLLVIGDSQTAGVVPNHQSFTNLLEERLASTRPDERVEALNCAVGGATPYSYLGLLEKYLHLELAPDLVLIVLFGGNDFSTMMPLQRFYTRRPPPEGRRFTKALLLEVRESSGSVLAHELGQAAYFANNPDDVEAALTTLASITVELEARCDEAGTRLAFAYLPTAFQVQPAHYPDELQAAASVLDFTEEQLGVSNDLAERWLAFLEARDLPCLDLRPALAAATEPLFWREDLHLNITGNERVAEALLPFVSQLVDEAP